MICAALSVIAMATLGGAIGPASISNTRSVSESPSWSETCQKIAGAVSEESQVYDFVSINYQKDIKHWASSSTQTAVCSFEPGTPEDVGIALKILGETRTPFAVKGGGHATNPGFSSTEGVQIAMSRFSDVVYDSIAQTATIGAGLIWDDVYAELEPHGVNVVGGRVSGVGVAGFTLGGGYSWLTNQYGLTIDTVQAFELVLPNGTVVDVTEISNSDLFFALKGGLNNFGIVTRFTLKTFPQTLVWGGVVVYSADLLDVADVQDKISQATANFAVNNADPKAAVITSYTYLSGLPAPTVIIFYDAPTPPAGIFDEFIAIFPSIQDLTTRSFPAFVESIPQPTPMRAVFNSVSLTSYPLSILQLIANEATSWNEKLSPIVSFINYDVEPFLPNFLNHNTTPSAYPPDRSKAFLPLEIYFYWASPDFDQVIYDAIRTTAETIQTHAVESGLNDDNAVVYSNYAIFDTPLVKLYGANVPRLQAIKKAVDPENVMGLAGGFKL